MIEVELPLIVVSDRFQAFCIVLPLMPLVTHEKKKEKEKEF